MGGRERAREHYKVISITDLYGSYIYLVLKFTSYDQLTFGQNYVKTLKGGFLKGQSNYLMQ